MFPTAASLILVLSSFSLAQSTVTASPPALEPPTQVRSLIAGALGNGAEIIRYGHLSAPDSLEAIGAVSVPGIPNSSDGIPISRLALLRQQGTQWVNALSANNGIRNDDGAITAPSQKSALYRLKLFQHRFDDGRQRWIMQFTPINPAGEPTARPIHISWNEILGRYQQISMEGYGFQPEFHGEAAD